MRIIAGEFKGRRLESPADDRVRPTTDKVREAIFSMISPWLQDALVVDLFAGTGGLGLEAVSRGAAHAVFCDSSRDSLKLVKLNISHCGAGDRATILQSDFRRGLASLNRKADIIFLDPPYEAGYMEDCFKLIDTYDCLADDGIIVAEHSKAQALADEIGPFVRIKEKRYGKISVSVYTYPDTEETEKDLQTEE